MSYSTQVLDHYENPRNVGKLDVSDDSVGTGLVGAPACGDVLKLQIKVEDGVIVDAKFKAYGCLTSNALINTPTKSKKISELSVGDEVLAWNGTNIVNQKIRAVLKHSVTIDDLLVVTFQRETSRKNIKSKTFSLICTKEHIFWNADNNPVEAQQLVAGQELYEITEHELRILTNNRHRVDLKEKNSKRMTEWNTQFAHSVLPQNQPGYVCKDLPLKKQRSAEASRKNWKDPAYVDKWRQGMANIDRSVPTSIEQKYINLFENNNVAARWCSGKVWIQSSTGPVSPDFVVPGKKKCIEVYTKRMPKFMQDRSEESIYVSNRREQLATAGYDSLFLAVEDFDHALPQVQNFIHNGMKIVSVEKITHCNQLRGCERDGKDVVVYDLKLEEGAHVFFSNRVGSHNCGSAIASSSLVTEWVKGKTLAQAAAITNSAIAEELSLPPVKIHCSILAEDCIKSAIADYVSKQQKSEPT
jgi:NifU-like protein involved in Fe-S cluster formation